MMPKGVEHCLAYAALATTVWVGIPMMPITYFAEPSYFSVRGNRGAGVSLENFLRD